MTSSMYIVLFLFLLVAVLFGGHYFLYFSIVRFFALSGMAKKILFAAVALLSVSFIIASLAAQISDNFLARSFYFLSGFWLGFAFYLIVASVVVWLIFWGSRIFSANINLSFWAVAFFTLAFLVSLYGSWNAFNLRVENITVDIPNLPTAWKNKKIVQISDLHLGLIHRDALMDKIVKEVNLIKPELVVITGDLFDSMDGRFNSFPDWIDQIQSEKGIYLVTGNHETYLGMEEVLNVLGKTKIRILNDEVVDLDGLKLIGIYYPNRSEDKDVIATLNSLRDDFFGQPNILLYHSPVLIDRFKGAGINLQLSGHTHNGQVFPINLITGLIHKGYSYGLYDEGDYNLYVTAGAGTWGPAMRVGTQSEIAIITIK